MIGEVVLGPQAESTTRSFLALRSDPRQQMVFSGWKTDGWVRWLEGLRGQYERRMNRMCTLLDEGMFRVVEVSSGGSRQSAGTGHREARTLRRLPVRHAGEYPSPDQDASAKAGADADAWTVVTKTQLYEYDWPRGGMFIWLRMLFDSHPLLGRPLPPPKEEDSKEGRDGAPPAVTGVMLSVGLMMLLTHAPYLTLVSPGLMFSANEDIRRDKGWQYYRLCFAAESEENIERCSKGFTQGVQAFWAIEDLETLKGLLDEAGGLMAAAGVEGFGGGEDEAVVDGLRRGVDAMGAGFVGC
jgi:hypothetical protein